MYLTFTQEYTPHFITKMTEEVASVFMKRFTFYSGKN